MRLKHKAWFFAGAALGLAIPIGVRVYERVLMLGEVPAYCPVAVLANISILGLRPMDCTEVGSCFSLVTNFR